VVRAKTAGRIKKLRERIGEGCPACKDWPMVVILRDDDPEPPGACDRCGRVFTGLVRVYVGVDPDAI
jgi:hypothetical protein